ncbi:MAG: DUF3429 domain-containing protein [Bosea sp.]|jgi:hypothetical protein|nr:DUF3429 domain-containing protein [Bosea sp. (in: a-proteobacteria)]
MSASASPPKVPLLLGALGLLPFLGLSFGLAIGVTLPLFEDADSMRVGLVGYGVAILSFLGGVRWGLAIKESEEGGSKADRDFIISVIPALIGWFAWFQSSPADLWWLVAAHVALGLLDYGLACRIIVPEWYGRLRLALSGIAAACLMLAAIAGG